MKKCKVVDALVPGPQRRGKATSMLQERNSLQDVHGNQRLKTQTSGSRKQKIKKKQEPRRTSDPSPLLSHVQNQTALHRVVSVDGNKNWCHFTIRLPL